MSKIWDFLGFKTSSTSHHPDNLSKTPSALPLTHTNTTESDLTRIDTSENNFYNPSLSPSPVSDFGSSVFEPLKDENNGSPQILPKNEGEKIVASPFVYDNRAASFDSTLPNGENNKPIIKNGDIEHGVALKSDITPISSPINDKTHSQTPNKTTNKSLSGSLFSKFRHRSGRKGGSKKAKNGNHNNYTSDVENNNNDGNEKHTAHKRHAHANGSTTIIKSVPPPSPQTTEGVESPNGNAEERILNVAAQISLPYLVAGLGMVAAGVLLDKVQHWTVFENVSELFILIPPLLGLKGNLEMTLASRISTQANLGNVDATKQFLKMARGNLFLLQIQAICLGFFVSFLALIMGFIPDGGTINLAHAQILLAACLVTTSLASAVLGVIMILVVYYTRKYGLNPDNMATPMAASLGDLVTLGILSLIARLLFNYMLRWQWVCLPIILMYVMFVPLWFILCRRNIFVKGVLNTGWAPIFVSIVISTIGGLILDYTVKRFNGIAVYQPVINGVGGNLVAIQASRLSTDFHKLGSPGTFYYIHNADGSITKAPTPATYNIWTTFFSKNFNAKMARLLILFALPGHIFFLFLISYIKNGSSIITFHFSLFYIVSAMLQVIILLYLANVIILSMWKRRTDPDNAAIPYLTAMGDLLGIAFLSISFFLLFRLRPRDPNLGVEQPF